MAISHKNIVKAKMVQLANVTSQAAERINDQILSGCSRELADNLGGELFERYAGELGVFDQAGFEAFDAKEFSQLNSDERWLRNILYAEAYFGLYLLAMSLRKLVKGAVNVGRESVGSAQITVAKYDDIVANAEYYREQAFVCLASAGTDDGNTFVDGTLGVFVV